MPELPEVEVIRRALVPWVVGRTIVEARIVEPRLTRRRGTPEEAATAVVGRRIRALRRRGKFFVFDLGEDSLIARLGMTGQLLWWDARITSGRTTIHRTSVSRVRILSYRDVRKFGDCIADACRRFHARHGVEPLTPPSLRRPSRMCRGCRVPDQGAPPGSAKDCRHREHLRDEALFRAASGHAAGVVASPGGDPALRRSIRAVLEAGIRHRGSSISDFATRAASRPLRALHRVYHRHGKPCVV
jgi:formamidopyrimidine-DNA glycosylase